MSLFLNQCSPQFINHREIFIEVALSMPGDSATEDVFISNDENYTLAVIRVENSGAAGLEFAYTLDTVNFIALSVWHIEGAAYATSLAAFTAGHLVVPISGGSLIRIRKTTGTGITSEIVGQLGFWDFSADVL